MPVTDTHHHHHQHQQQQVSGGRKSEATTHSRRRRPCSTLRTSLLLIRPCFVISACNTHQHHTHTRTHNYNITAPSTTHRSLRQCNYVTFDEFRKLLVGAALDIETIGGVITGSLP